MEYISRPEYLKKMLSDREWLPGRDAIIEAHKELISRDKILYIPAAALIKNGTGLDGFCAYKSGPHDICITTCGLSQIYPNEDAYGRMRSGWGIEFTVRWTAEKLAECTDAFKLLARLVQFVQIRKTVPPEYCTLSFSGVLRFPELKSDSFSGILIVPACDLKTIQTIHGDVRLLQIVNVTKPELDILKRHPGMAKQLIFNMQKQSSELVIDPLRKQYYLE